MMISTSQTQLIAKFVTKSTKYAVPDNPFSIPSNSTPTTLNALVKTFLKENLDEEDNKQLITDIDSTEFDFLINGEYIHLSLDEFINRHSETIQTESVIEIEYVERYPAPEPFESITTNDWVSSVRGLGDMILVGSYDHSVQLWNTEGESLAELQGHSGAVKAVAWVSSDNETNMHKFISASHDQSLIIWSWNQNKNSVEQLDLCVGHKESVECVDVNFNTTKFISGSWDRMLKLWSLSKDGLPEEDKSNKKSKSETKTTNKTPLITLSGHAENISACKWMSETRVCTASWDHTIKVWDVHAAQETNTLASQNKIFLAIDYSQLNNLIVAGLNDRHVRLYDPRSNEGSFVKGIFTSHTGWCTSVAWSKKNANLFVSGSYDNVAKLWDVRSPKAPLYDLTGHEDKVLCVDWSIDEFILTGSADNSLKIFRSNQAATVKNGHLNGAKSNGESSKKKNKKSN